VEDTLAGVADAVDAVYHSDAAAYVGLWSDRWPVSLFGALGPCELGNGDVAQALHGVAARFSDGAMSIDYDVVEVGADLAYTVGYETGQVSIDGSARPTRIRVTHIYRLERGTWRLVHRHGDLTPIDPQTTQTADS
jgi:ketosteroid isomerase-like protein